MCILEGVAKPSDGLTKTDSKRKKVLTNTAANRLYPVLSDIESTTATESDPDNYTTATVTSSDDRGGDEGYYNQAGYRRQPHMDEDSYEEEDR